MATPAPALPPGVLSLHVLPAEHHDKDWDAIIVPAGGRCSRCATVAASAPSPACRTA